jgi:hypothetical protein
MGDLYLMDKDPQHLKFHHHEMEDGHLTLAPSNKHLNVTDDFKTPLWVINVFLVLGTFSMKQ